MSRVGTHRQALLRGILPSLCLYLVACAAEFPAQIPSNFPPPTIKISSYNLSAGIVMPSGVSDTPFEERFRCWLDIPSGVITGPLGKELERRTLATFSKTFATVELVRDKAAAIGRYDVLIEVEAPQLHVHKNCGWYFRDPTSLPLAPFLLLLDPFFPADPVALQVAVSARITDYSGSLSLTEGVYESPNVELYQYEKWDIGRQMIRTPGEAMDIALTSALKGLITNLLSSPRLVQYAQSLSGTPRQRAEARARPQPPSAPPVRETGPAVAQRPSESIQPADQRGVRVGGKTPAEVVAEQTGKSWAVVIGIDDYQRSNVGALKYAVADARAVATELEQRGYQVTTLYNGQATRRAIESELRTKLPKKVGKDDRVLIFYAGHGQDDQVEGGKVMGYLLPVDGEREDVPATGISMGTVKELADALPAKHVLFLLDVCFGGIAGNLSRGQPPIVTDAYLKQITRERGRHLITAGEANQEVIEAPQWGHSVFTYFLLKGLSEGLADLDGNGIITAQELYTYLEPRVFGEAQLQGHKQKPQWAELSGEKGQFVFFTAKSPSSQR